MKQQFIKPILLSILMGGLLAACNSGHKIGDSSPSLVAAVSKGGSTQIEPYCGAEGKKDLGKISAELINKQWIASDTIQFANVVKRCGSQQIFAKNVLSSYPVIGDYTVSPSPEINASIQALEENNPVLLREQVTTLLNTLKENRFIDTSSSVGEITDTSIEAEEDPSKVMFPTYSIKVNINTIEHDDGVDFLSEVGEVNFDFYFSKNVENNSWNLDELVIKNYDNEKMHRLAEILETFNISKFERDVTKYRSILTDLQVGEKNVLAAIAESIGYSTPGLIASVDTNKDNSFKFIFTGDPSKQNSPYVDELSKLIKSAKKSIEFATLTPPDPDAVVGGNNLSSMNTYQHLVNAFAELAKESKDSHAVDIRIVYGRMPTIVDKQLNQPHIDEQAYLTRLVNDIKKASQLDNLPFHIQFTGFARSGQNTGNLLSWNHSKVIVIDGKDTNIGGTNLYEGYNDQFSPIKDVSTTFINNSSIASKVHKYIYNLANAPQETGYNTTWMSANKTAEYNNNAVSGINNQECIKTFLSDKIEETDAKSANMILAPRYGYIKNGNDEIRNLSDIEQVALIDQAKKELFISQQAIYPMNKIAGQTVGKSMFNAKVIFAIQNALRRGVAVTIVKSPDKSIAPDGGSYDGLSIQETRDVILKPLGQDVKATLVIKVPFINEKSVANHAKVIIIDHDSDNATAYMGSHNLYDASHAEYGYIIQDHKFVNKLFTEYNNQLNSKSEK